MDIFDTDGSFTLFSLHILVFGILFIVVFDALCSYISRKRLQSRLCKLEQEREELKAWSISIYEYLKP